jgi:hypothetical protein
MRELCAPAVGPARPLLDVILAICLCVFGIATRPAIVKRSARIVLGFIVPHCVSARVAAGALRDRRTG